jgi:hypothetical protein
VAFGARPAAIARVRADRFARFLAATEDESTEARDQSNFLARLPVEHMPVQVLTPACVADHKSWLAQSEVRPRKENTLMKKILLAAIIAMASMTEGSVIHAQEPVVAAANPAALFTSPIRN